MTKCSLTPSVTLMAKIPTDCCDSFVNGRVVTTVNDSVFETSSPWRHAATTFELVKDTSKKILILYTDGGVDHRHTLESVRCSLVCLSLGLNLDMLIAGRCAPGWSFTNPAERIMSVLNLG